MTLSPNPDLRLSLNAEESCGEIIVRVNRWFRCWYLRLLDISWKKNGKKDRSECIDESFFNVHSSLAEGSNTLMGLVNFGLSLGEQILECQLVLDKAIKPPHSPRHERALPTFELNWCTCNRAAYISTFRRAYRIFLYCAHSSSLRSCACNRRMLDPSVASLRYPLVFWVSTETRLDT